LPSRLTSATAMPSERKVRSTVIFSQRSACFCAALAWAGAGVVFAPACAGDDQPISPAPATPASTHTASNHIDTQPEATTHRERMLNRFMERLLGWEGGGQQYLME
jgi:hypothetical protein